MEFVLSCLLLDVILGIFFPTIHHAAPESGHNDSTKICSDFSSILSLHPKLASLVGEIVASLAAKGT